MSYQPCNQPGVLPTSLACKHLAGAAGENEAVGLLQFAERGRLDALRAAVAREHEDKATLRELQEQEAGGQDHVAALRLPLYQGPSLCSWLLAWPAKARQGEPQCRLPRGAGAVSQEPPHGE